MPVKQTILIVDDDSSIRDMLAMNLKASYDVLVAHDGIDAAQVYERNVERVAAIVTDLDMPRLNGQLLTEWVHHICPRLPIIIMSGHVSSVNREELLRNPAVRFLSKPFASAQLQALLMSALGKNGK